MEMIANLSNKAQKFLAHVTLKLSSFINSLCRFMKQIYQFMIFHSDPLLVQLCYFLSVTFVGFFALKILNPKDEEKRPQNLDLLFTSVSALTVSSMATVEMEVFSECQLWILTLLMLVGGEVFISMLSLQLIKAKLCFEMSINERVDTVGADLELQAKKQDYQKVIDAQDCNVSSVARSDFYLTKREQLKYAALRSLVHIILSYLVIALLSGSIAIFLYLSFVSDARDLLRTKGIRILVFSVFTAVSSFVNCGYIPTNENMMIFKKNSALLILIIPQILAGNTLFPAFLRFSIWILKKITKRGEFSYILQHSVVLRYKHLLPHKHSIYLVFTVVGFIMVQFLLFCILEWNSEVLKGLNSYQKAAGALFQSANSRHAGESIVDISVISPAILVLYMVMMYLPPYTSFLPVENDELPSADANGTKGGRKILQNLILSQLSYVIIFIILICVIERKSLSEDPLNFNVLNIVFEVISAYGNVGFSIGYSCKRLLKPDGHCKDAWYGFVGRWSTGGKVILMVVMLFGRLKKFNMEGGKAWKIF